MGLQRWPYVKSLLSLCRRGNSVTVALHVLAPMCPIKMMATIAFPSTGLQVEASGWYQYNCAARGEKSGEREGDPAASSDCHDGDGLSDRAASAVLSYLYNSIMEL